MLTKIHHNHLYRISLTIILVVTALLIPNFRPRADSQTPSDPTTSHTIYLPLISTNPDPWGLDLPLVTGTYIDGWLAEQYDINSRLLGMDTWLEEAGGARLSIAATFVDIETPNYSNFVYEQLLLPWKNGYTPFVNLSTNRSAYAVASGQVDNALRNWAKALADYAQGGKRYAFIAPLQEMNGGWIPYGLDPTNFKIAFTRIKQIFAQEGVTEDDVVWVFAPNGWHKPGTPPFEAYYPGDDVVEMVGFSGYNFGYCSPSPEWQHPGEVFGPYIERMRNLAPFKPLFIAQTASSSNGGDKNQWLQESYKYLANQPGVRAVLYFNIDKECDWAVYKTWGGNQRRLEGYRQGVANPDYVYAPPSELLELLQIP